ncbi:MAG: hypothetical protein K2J60_13475 [Acetatifactor sp.]|nr:hypothetical protein [Acetatifactor sp.]
MESSVNSIIDRYAELSQGVNSFTNENKSLSTDKYEEFLDLNKQLARLFPSLTRDYDDNCNAILGLSGSVDSVTESIRALVEQEKELAKAKIRDNIEQYFDGTDEADGAWKALEGKKKNLEETNEALNSLTNTYNTLINSDEEISIGRVHENMFGRFYGVYADAYKKEYIDYIKNNFGEDIANAVKDVTHTYIGQGLTGQFADIVVDFSQLELTEKQKEQITSSYDTFYNELSAKRKTAMSEFDLQNSEFSNNATFWLEDLDFYKDSDKYVQLAMQKFVHSIEWSDYDAEQLDYDGVKRIIQDSILTPFQVACENPDTKKKLDEAFANLFTLDMSDMPVNDALSRIDSYIETIAAALHKNTIELKASLGFDDYDDMPRRFQNAVSMLTGERNSKEYAELVEIINNLKLNEVELCLNAINDAENVTDALNGVKEALESISDADEPQTLSTKLTSSAESLDKFQSSVKSAADAYATLLSGNYSSTELLDSIQAINQAATDMGESINWEEIDSLDLLGDKLEEVSQKYLESIADIDVDSGFGKILANIIQAQKASTQLEVLNSQIDSLQSAYSDLTDIVASYNDMGRINFDQLKKLLEMEPQYLTCLVDENGQLQINETAMTALANQRLDDAEAQAIQQAITELGMLAMQDEESAVKENAQAFNNAINDLAGYNEELANTIAETGVATSLIRDLNAALQGAESDGATDNQIDTVLNNLKTKLQLIGNVRKQIDNDGLDSGFGSAGKDVGKAFTDALYKELAALDKKMEAGYIDFNDYIQARLTLIEDYYNQGKLSADEYYSYLEKHYDTQLSYMDKVVNAVTRRIDTELDALKQQKEDVENIYKVQIESLEKEKNLLEEANKERQRQKDLQKSLYDLEKAKNQRTQLVYTKDKGMHYVADDQSIRDAQESVDSARYDIKISEIEKTISNLEESRDRQTNAIDEMISNLEAYKNAWNDVTSAYEEEQENLFAAQILGADWETDILNGRLDVLDAFKNQYISIQQAMAAAAWKSANEQVKAAKEAEKGASGSPSKAPDIRGSNDKPSEDDNPQTPKTSGGGGGSFHSLSLGGNKLVYTSLKAYASGTNNAKKGLNFVGEDGPEAYFDNHGHVAIVTKPTLIPKEGGEVVKNERDTKKLLDPDNIVPVDTIELADSDGKEAERATKVFPDSRTLILVSQEEYIRELLQKASITPKQVQTEQIYPETDLPQGPERCAAAMGRSFESMMNPMNLIAHNMQELTGMGKYMNNMNNIRNTQPVINGGINITCPGVTSKEVAKQLPGVLNEALEREFSGLHLQAMQWS